MNREDYTANDVGPSGPKRSWPIPAFASLIILSVLFGFVMSPADPISMYLMCVGIVALVASSFWLGLQAGKNR